MPRGGGEELLAKLKAIKEAISPAAYLKNGMAGISSSRLWRCASRWRRRQ